jgi:hypothetical protein
MKKNTQKSQLGRKTHQQHKTTVPPRSIFSRTECRSKEENIDDKKNMV